MPRQPQADLRERVAEAVLRQQVYLRATLSRAITTSITHIGLSPRDSTLFPPSSIATAKSRVTRKINRFASAAGPRRRLLADQIPLLMTATPGSDVIPAVPRFG